jgi:hypothetical protein
MMRNSLTAFLASAVAAMMMATSSLASEMPPKQVRLITSPEVLPLTHDRPRVFLGGSIDMGSAPDWQAAMVRALADENVVVLNPRRADWKKEWRPDVGEPHFRQQVEWELSALESADIIVLYLSPGSQSPISLLEMGLYARSGKLIILCPEGYWRKGNVDITAARYGVERVESMGALIQATKARLASWKQR